MTTKETVSLMKQIRDGATSSDIPLGQVLRLCMRLGQQLSNEELMTWARKEASGYENMEELPDYRVLPAEVRGDFFGPFQSGLKNAQIPRSVIDEKHRDWLYSVSLMEPVNQLEQYARGKDGRGTYQIPWSADIVAYYQSKEIYSNGLVLGSAWRMMSGQNVLGVLETIRTRVLDFILQLQSELQLDLDEPDQTQSLKIDTPQVNNTINNTIYGGNVALSNDGNASIGTINITSGSLDELKGYMESIGVKKADTELLTQSIQQDGDTKGEVGPAVSTWLAQMGIKALKGGLKIGKEVAVTCMTKAIMQYYHIPV